MPSGGTGLVIAVIDGGGILTVKLFVPLFGSLAELPALSSISV